MSSVTDDEPRISYVHTYPHLKSHGRVRLKELLEWAQKEAVRRNLAAAKAGLSSSATAINEAIHRGNGAAARSAGLTPDEGSALVAIVTNPNFYKAVTDWIGHNPNKPKTVGDSAWS